MHMGVSVDDVRRVAAQLPLTSEVMVNDRLKFRVGRIVWLAFSQDQREMGFAFPKNERLALVAGEPDVFLMPRATDLRFNWIEVRLDSLELDRMTELVHQAWRMVVPNSVATTHFTR
jgi:hypothetical protein